MLPSPLVAGLSPRRLSPPGPRGGAEARRSPRSPRWRWSAGDASSRRQSRQEPSAGDASSRGKKNKIPPRAIRESSGNSTFTFSRDLEGGDVLEEPPIQQPAATAHPLPRPPRGATPPSTSPRRPSTWGRLLLQAEELPADLEPGVQHFRRLMAEDNRHLIEAFSRRMEAVQRELLDAQSAAILEAVARSGGTPGRHEAELEERLGGHRPDQKDGLASHSSPRVAPKEMIPEAQAVFNSSSCNSCDAHGDERAGSKRSLSMRTSQISESLNGRSSVKKSESAAAILEATKAIGERRTSLEEGKPVIDIFAGASRQVGDYSQVTRVRYHELIDAVHAVLKRLSEGFPEPEGKSSIDWFVTSWVFAYWCAFVILLNAVFIAASTNYEVQHPGDGSSSMVKGAEYAFVIWYIIEMLLKMVAHGRYFFVGPDYKWNWFDIFLVCISAIPVVLMSGAANFSFARSLRLFKITKVFHVFRFMEFFKDVKVMVLCMVQSFLAVFWCLVIIAFMLYFVAVMILQAVIMHLETLESSEDVAWFQEEFPSVQRTMVVLFQSTTGGIDWHVPYDGIGRTGQSWAQLFFLFYIAFFAIAVWNIVTALFIEKAMCLTEPDRHELMLRQRRQELKDIAELKGLFNEMDIDDSKTLSTAEFQNAMHKVPEFRHFFEQRGIHIKEAGTLFTMIAQSTGNDLEVDIDTMIACFLRLKGMATSIDLSTMRFEMKRALREQKKVLDDVRHCLAHVGAGVAETCNRVVAIPSLPEPGWPSGTDGREDPDGWAGGGPRSGDSTP